MQQNSWYYALIGLVLLGGPHVLSYADDAAPETQAPASASAAGSHSSHNRSGGTHGGFGFAAALDRKLGLTPEQKDAVRGLLAQQHQQSVALREQTDQKIRALLNSEQQKKFDSMLAEQKASRSHSKES